MKDFIREKLMAIAAGALALISLAIIFLILVPAMIALAIPFKLFAWYCERRQQPKKTRQ